MNTTQLPQNQERLYDEDTGLPLARVVQPALDTSRLNELINRHANGSIAPMAQTLPVTRLNPMSKGTGSTWKVDPSVVTLALGGMLTASSMMSMFLLFNSRPDQSVVALAQKTADISRSSMNANAAVADRAVKNAKSNTCISFWCGDRGSRDESRVQSVATTTTANTQPVTPIRYRVIPGNFAPGLNFRDAPNGNVINTAPPGTQISQAVTVSNDGQWVQVDWIENGNAILTGWVSAKYYDQTR
jgi:hypothetical protein